MTLTNMIAEDSELPKEMAKCAVFDSKSTRIKQS